jgi:adenine phosphoribosyltransferase
MTMETHRIKIGNIVRDLPIREVAPRVRVALFNLLGDWELTEAAGAELAMLIPFETQALIMPDGKALALLHVMGRISGLPTFVARKELKAYMAAPALEVSLKSITTNKVQQLFLGRDDADRLNGLDVAIVDDVVSTGGTLAAVRELLTLAGAKESAVMAAFTEGDPRTDVISLGCLPLF